MPKLPGKTVERRLLLEIWTRKMMNRFFCLRCFLQCADVSSLPFMHISKRLWPRCLNRAITLVVTRVLRPTVLSDLILFLRYKDGCKIQPSDNITLQAEGTMRRLIIRSAETSDAGSYTCQAGNNTIEFTVNVRGTGRIFFVVCKNERPMIKGFLLCFLHKHRTSCYDRGT